MMEILIPKECINGHSITEACQEYATALLEDSQRKLLSRNTYRDAYIDAASPAIKADKNDYRNFYPVTVTIYRRLSGELVYGLPEGVQTTDNEGVEAASIVMGGTSISIPADGVFDIPQVPEITISLPWIGTILTRLGMGALVIGALNLTSPRVQQENFELIKEKPVEVGSITIWMKDNGGNQAKGSEGSFVKGVRRFFETMLGRRPQPAAAQQPSQPEKPEPNAEPPQEKEPAPRESIPPKTREEFLSRTNGDTVLIPKNRSQFEDILKWDSYFKFIVVKRENGKIELRLNPGATGSHNSMALKGEKVIGAGQLQLRPDGRLQILGNSTAYPTSKNGIELTDEATHEIDSEAGLKNSVEFIRGLLPQNEIVKDEHYTGYGDMYTLQIHF